MPITTKKRHNDMERFDEKLERPIDPVLDAEYIKMLGSLGLVWANVNESKSTDRPDDSVWPILY